MVNISGRGKISIPSQYEEQNKLDMEIEYAKNKTLLLTATNWLIKQQMMPMQRGEMVRFEGLLDESEPGYYYVKLSLLEKTKKLKGDH